MSKIEILLQVHNSLAEFVKIEQALRLILVSNENQKVEDYVKEIRAILNHQSEKFQPLMVELNKLTQDGG